MAGQYQYFSSNIKYLRTSNKESRKKLAEALNLSPSAISNYEYGSREPGIQLLLAIASHYGITVDQLTSVDLSFFENTDHDASYSPTVKDIFEIWDCMIPLISSDFALSNESFRKAIETCKKVKTQMTKGEIVIGSLLDYCIENFIDAYDKFGIVEAVADYIWIIILSWSCIIDEKEAVKLNSYLMSNPKKEINQIDFLSLLSEETKGKRRLYLNEVEENLIECIKILVNDEKYHDLGQYYLGLRYCIGMIDTGLTLEMNSQIGVQMLLSQVQVGNKYALKYLKKCFGL